MRIRRQPEAMPTSAGNLIVGGTIFPRAAPLCHRVNRLQCDIRCCCSFFQEGGKTAQGIKLYSNEYFAGESDIHNMFFFYPKLKTMSSTNLKISIILIYKEMIFISL